MTGRARLDSTGEIAFMRDVPELVERAESSGLPVIVELRPELDPAIQRLLASLGVLVRFSETAPPMTRRRTEAPTARRPDAG